MVLQLMRIGRKDMAVPTSELGTRFKTLRNEKISHAMKSDTDLYGVHLRMVLDLMSQRGLIRHNGLGGVEALWWSEDMPRGRSGAGAVPRLLDDTLGTAQIRHGDDADRGDDAGNVGDHLGGDVDEEATDFDSASCSASALGS